MNKKKFILPDFYGYRNLNMKLIDDFIHRRELFNDNIEIEAIYGTFPMQIWNGGRPNNNSEQVNLEKANSIIKSYNDLGIKVRFTYTNCLVKEVAELSDVYCNMITKVGNNGKNEILVNSKILEMYLRDNYKNYNYILSTTKCERNIDNINKYTKEYHCVVLDYRDNKNFEFLDKIEDKDKIEFLLNATCNDNCLVRSRHYESMSKNNLYFTNDSFKCPYKNSINLYETMKKNKNFITKEELFSDKYDSFQYFKLEGRCFTPIYYFESIIYYLIKEEYQNYYRVELLTKADMLSNPMSSSNNCSCGNNGNCKH